MALGAPPRRSPRLKKNFGLVSGVQKGGPSMKNYRMFLLAVFYSYSVQAQIATTDKACCISPEETEHLMNLPFQDFDQNHQGGWRSYQEKIGCYETAVGLLEKYKSRNIEKLNSAQVRILTWHAGQIDGFVGDTATARARFISAFDPNEPADSPLLWNDYVLASVAFLDHDLEMLQAHRNRIARGPVGPNGKPGNLNVVDNLIKYFDKSYGVAYSGGNSPLEARVCGK